MKKTMKKIVALGSGATLLVAASVMGTMAYLTATTGTVNNTFTLGKVTLSSDLNQGLDEAKVDQYGNEEEGEARVTANTYKLIPGHTYTKDPTVHITADSENCYLFVRVVNDISAIEDEKTIATQMAEKGWVQIEDTNVYYYAPDKNDNKIVDENEDLVVVNGTAKDVIIFDNFTIKDDADVASLADENGDISSKITIQAYAVQADGFSSALAAWEVAPCNWGTTSTES